MKEYCINNTEHFREAMCTQESTAIESAALFQIYCLVEQESSKNISAIKIN